MIHTALLVFGRCHDVASANASKFRRLINTAASLRGIPAARSLRLFDGRQPIDPRREWSDGVVQISALLFALTFTNRTVDQPTFESQRDTIRQEIELRSRTRSTRIEGRRLPRWPSTVHTFYNRTRPPEESCPGGESRRHCQVAGEHPTRSPRYGCQGRRGPQALGGRTRRIRSS